MNTEQNVICVLTARGLETILSEGGSQAWVLDAKRAKQCSYVVCVQNRGFADDWGHASAPHHTAFLVGKLDRVERSKEEPNSKRWILIFSEFAEIDVENAWPGYRNPVYYTDFKALGIELEKLEFQPMPEDLPDETVDSNTAALTIAQAKEGLAMTFGVKPEDIEIIIRG